MKEKDKKTLIIIGVVVVVAVIAYLLFFKNGNGAGSSDNAGDPTGYGALAQMFGEAATMVNKSFEGYQQNKYNYNLNKAQQTYDQINYSHNTNQMYWRTF